MGQSSAAMWSMPQDAAFMVVWQKIDKGDGIITLDLMIDQIRAAKQRPPMTV